MRAIDHLNEKADEIFLSIREGKDYGKELRKALCVDLSATGLCMISGHHLPGGSFVKVTITIPPLHPVTIILVGKIVNVNKIQLSSGKRLLRLQWHMKSSMNLIGKKLCHTALNGNVRMR